jgi:serine/threonine protein kinase
MQSAHARSRNAPAQNARRLIPPFLPTPASEHPASAQFTGQFVALKFISKAGKSEADLSALRQEISILRRLDHENIVLLLDHFETQRWVRVRGGGGGGSVNQSSVS